MRRGELEIESRPCSRADIPSFIDLFCCPLALAVRLIRLEYLFNMCFTDVWPYPPSPPPSPLRKHSLGDGNYLNHTGDSLTRQRMGTSPHLSHILSVGTGRVLSLAADEKHVYAGCQSRDNEITVFSRSSLQPLFRLLGHEGSVLALLIVKEKGWLVSSSSAGDVRVSRRAAGLSSPQLTGRSGRQRPSSRSTSSTRATTRRATSIPWHGTIERAALSTLVHRTRRLNGSTLADLYPARARQASRLSRPYPRA